MRFVRFSLFIILTRASDSLLVGVEKHAVERARTESGLSAGRCKARAELPTVELPLVSLHTLRGALPDDGVVLAVGGFSDDDASIAADSRSCLAPATVIPAAGSGCSGGDAGGDGGSRAEPGCDEGGDAPAPAVAAEMRSCRAAKLARASP